MKRYMIYEAEPLLVKFLKIDNTVKHRGGKEGLG